MAEHNLQRVPAELDLEEQVLLEAAVMEVMDQVVAGFRPPEDWDLVTAAAASFVPETQAAAVVVADILAVVEVAVTPQGQVPEVDLVTSAARALPVALPLPVAEVLRVIMPMLIEVQQELEELVPEVAAAVDLSLRKTTNIGNISF
jgi:hypothetical protein